MNKRIYFLIVVVLLFVSSQIHAEDIAFTTPEDNPEVTTTIPEILSADEATTTTPTASTTTPLPPVSITLTIETPDGTLISGTRSVTACTPYATSPTESITGYCAVLQSGIPATWSWFGTDTFIESLGGIPNDFVAGAYWNWFSNLTFGMSALNTHTLVEHESLLITIGQLPLRIKVSDSAFSTGSSTTIQVEEFGFDASFNPVWTASASSTVRIGEDSFETDSKGAYIYTPLVSGSVSISAEKEGYLNSAVHIVEVTGEEIPLPPISSSAGTHTQARVQDPSDSAKEFLLLHQNGDGSFFSSLLTDWSAIGLARTDASTDTLMAYLLHSSNPTSITDYERRAMALSALGLANTFEIDNILKAFDGTQIGDPYLGNDDIFALILLAHAGYGTDDSVIKKVVSFVIKKQLSNGSWGSVDLTAAAIQALTPLDSLSDVHDSVRRAKAFLISAQQDNGCFGNIFSTSWAVMAIRALGESPHNWKKESEASAYACLLSLQASDGGFETNKDINTRIWATAYALPALQSLAWDDILHYSARVAVPDYDTATNDKDFATPPAEIVQELPRAEIAANKLTLPTDKIVTKKVDKTIVLQQPTLTASVASAIQTNQPVTESSLWSRLLTFLSRLYRLLHLQ